MICLRCGKSQPKPGAVRCHSCKVGFGTVSGLFGTNNISQLLESVEDCGKGELSLAKLRDRFAIFVEVWESFVDSWHLEEQTILEALELNATLTTVYADLLGELEEALNRLNQGLDLLDSLKNPEPVKLAEIDEQIRLFARLACSACAGLFTKLETREGDFDSLLSMFEDP